MKKEELNILKKIKPTKEEVEFVEKFVEKLLEVATKIAKPFYAHPTLVGSISKGTWLKGSHDIDLFLVFRRRIDRKELEELGLKIGVEICKNFRGTYNIKYAEHPYVKCNIKNFQVDIVPCYEIKKDEKIISAVDRSPLHARYIKENIKDFEKDEVRLLKYFCKQLGIYGADAKINGVSGYLCELLIINYGTFNNALDKISKLNFGDVIDLEGVVDKYEVRKKFRDAIIVIDPVDKNRNVASPLSAQNFLKLKLAAKKYLQTGKFPERKIITKLGLIEKLKKERGTNFIGLKFKPPDIITENLYPQLRKFEKKLVKYLESKDFFIVRHFSWTDEKNKAYIILEVESTLLAKYKKKDGPIIFSKEVDNFLKKYINEKYKPYIEDKKFFICYKRKIRDIKVAIRTFLKNNKAEIPKKIVSRRISLFEESEIIKEVNENKELNSYLIEKYFEI